VTDQIDKARRDAFIAGSVGRSIRNLSPTVKQALQQRIVLESRNGTLTKNWEAALEKAAQTKSPLTTETLALAAVLTTMVNAAAELLNDRGDQLIQQQGYLTARAEVLEELKAAEDKEAADAAAADEEEAGQESDSAQV
jgi:uncharacterized membrane protein YheB (UPF0754 family)